MAETKTKTETPAAHTETKTVLVEGKVVGQDRAPETKRYRLREARGPHHGSKPNDDGSYNLTERQYAAFRDKFEPLDDETPVDSSRKPGEAQDDQFSSHGTQLVNPKPGTSVLPQDREPLKAADPKSGPAPNAANTGGQQPAPSGEKKEAPKTKPVEGPQAGKVQDNKTETNDDKK